MLNRLDVFHTFPPWDSFRKNLRPRLPQDVACEHRLDLVDAELFVELLLNWRCSPRDPNLQLGIKIKGARRLDAEVGDALVRDRVVLHLASRDALLVDENKPLVGENEVVADQLVGVFNLLARSKNLAEICLNLRCVNL